MALLPEYRQRLVKRILEYDAISRERGGRLYHYEKAATAVMIICILIFPIATGLLPSQYLPYFVLTFVIVFLAAWAVQIVALLKSSRKWALLLIAISVAIAALRILILQYLGI